MRTVQILLAEDNEADVVLIRHALQTHNVPHELHVIHDGAKAKDLVAKIGTPGFVPHPDLILLDLNLPMVDGTEVLKELRKYPRFAKTPVVIVTSSDAPRDRALVAELGISHYFTKPSDWDAFMELGAVVRQVVEKMTPPADFQDEATV